MIKEAKERRKSKQNLSIILQVTQNNVSPGWSLVNLQICKLVDLLDWLNWAIDGYYFWRTRTNVVSKSKFPKCHHSTKLPIHESACSLMLQFNHPKPCFNKFYCCQNWH